MILFPQSLKFTIIYDISIPDRSASATMSVALGPIGGVIGLFGDIFQLAGTLKTSLFPGPSPEDLNVFRVHVGQVFHNDTNRDHRSTGGDAPTLAGWDTIGEFLGQDTPTANKGPKIEAGSFRDYSIVGRQEIDYLSVVQNGDDGICIHLITGKSANAGRLFAWNGDLGKACGAHWYPQPDPVTIAGPHGSEFHPACVWIDGNGDNGHNFRGFNFHLGSFGGDLSDGLNNATAAAWQKNKDLLCRSEPRFSFYEDVKIGMQNKIFETSPTSFDVGTPDYDNAVLNRDNWVLGDLPDPSLLPQRYNGRTFFPAFICPTSKCPPTGASFDMNLEMQNFTRRGIQSATKDQREDPARTDDMVDKIKKRQTIHANRLVVSKIVGHSAIELCNSITSLGPDLVSMMEGMFCDMSEKQLWPVCVEDDESYCFDMAMQIVRASVATSGTNRGPDVSVTHTESSANAGTVVKVGTREYVLDFAVPLKAYTDVSTWAP